MIAAPRRRASREGQSILGFTCPECRSPLTWRHVCNPCKRSFPEVASIPDFRLAPDRYLSLDAERAKAESLASKAETSDFKTLCRDYYAITPDVDPSRADRYLAHLQQAESRAEAFVEMLPTTGRTLEIGCGTGGMLAVASRRGLAIEGVDIALRWLILARQRAQNLRLTAANADRLPWPDATFAAIFADSVLEHLDDPVNALCEWHRVAKPNARLILVSPNRYSLLPDPHVGLWGLGFLPRHWQAAYVQNRRRCAWPVRPFSAAEAKRIALESGWRNVRIEAAPAPLHLVQFAKSCYQFGRKTALISPALRRFGPLWLLTAERGDRP